MNTKEKHSNVRNVGNLYWRNTHKYNECGKTFSQKKYLRDQEKMHTGDCAFRHALSGVKCLSLTLSSVLLNLIPHSMFQNPHKEEII